MGYMDTLMSYIPLYSWHLATKKQRTFYTTLLFDIEKHPLVVHGFIILITTKKQHIFYG
jgi:hypothetical protein